MDFLTYSGKSKSDNREGDLVLDPSTNDIMECDSVSSVQSVVRELFEMKPADDLSHPDFYSLQRKHYAGEYNIQERERNAVHILKMILGVDEDSIRAVVDGDTLIVDFKLTGGGDARVTL